MNALRLLIVLSATLLVTGQASAQRKVSLRTLCFQHVGGIKEVYVTTGTPEKPVHVPLRLYTSTYSDESVLELPGSELQFSLRSTNEDGTSGQKVFAKGKMSTGKRQLALFLPSGKDADTPYAVRIIDETESKFPMGSTLVYNLTSTDTRITIGEHKAETKSGARSLLPLAKKTNALNQTTVRVYLKTGPDAWKPVSSTVWIASEKTRSLALAYIHPRTKKPTVNCFQETPPWRLPKVPEE